MNESQEKPLSCSPNVQVNEVPARNSSSGERVKCVEAVFHLEDHLKGAGGEMCSLGWQLRTPKEEGNRMWGGTWERPGCCVTFHLVDLGSELSFCPRREHSPENVHWYICI